MVEAWRTESRDVPAFLLRAWRVSHRGARASRGSRLVTEFNFSRVLRINCPLVSMPEYLANGHQAHRPQAALQSLPRRLFLLRPGLCRTRFQQGGRAPTNAKEAAKIVVGHSHSGPHSSTGFQSSGSAPSEPVHPLMLAGSTRPGTFSYPFGGKRLGRCSALR